MKVLTQKEREVNDLARAAQKITERADSEDRTMTDDEISQVNSFLDKAERLRDSSSAESRMDKLFTGGRICPGSTQLPLGDPDRPRSASADSWRDSDGREVRMLVRNQSVADELRRTGRITEQDAGLSLGRAIVGIAGSSDRRWDGAEREQRLMQEGLGAGGGYLVPDALASAVIDKTRNRMACMAAGARTFDMPTADVTLARVETDPVAYWRPEATAITASDMAVGGVKLQAKTVGILVPMSIEIVEDSPNAADVLENAIAEQLALKLDYAALNGTGAGEPLGIANFSNATQTSIGGAFDLDDIVDGMKALWDGNYEPNAILWNAQEAASHEKLVDSNSDYLANRPPSVAAIAKYRTNQVTAGEMFLGEWSRLLFGIRTSLKIEVSRTGSDGSNDAFSKMLVLVRAYMRCDIVAEREQAFARLYGIS